MRMQSEITHTVSVPLLLGLFGIIFVLSVSDVVLDHLEGASALHIGVETLIVILAAVGSGMLIREVAQSRAESGALRERLASTQREAEEWRREARTFLEGLGAAIDQQFTRWHFTPAEREVAMYLLKGLSHKEIAKARNVSERTVRQQAQTLYGKGNLSGRSHLAAYFLEDLLLPQTAATTDDATV